MYINSFVSEVIYINNLNIFDNVYFINERNAFDRWI